MVYFEAAAKKPKNWSFFPIFKMTKRGVRGLGDVNPQYLTVFATAPLINDYVIKQINLPVTRLGGSKNKAVVFEILSVDWYFAVDNIDSVITQTNMGFFSTGT